MTATVDAPTAVRRGHHRAAPDAELVEQLEDVAGVGVGRARGERSEGTLFLGMVQHGADPAGFAAMLADAPLPVRWLLPRLARRRFRRYALQVHGTDTP